VRHNTKILLVYFATRIMSLSYCIYIRKDDSYGKNVELLFRDIHMNEAGKRKTLRKGTKGIITRLIEQFPFYEVIA
jgi:hypothetical protein